VSNGKAAAALIAAGVLAGIVTRPAALPSGAERQDAGLRIERVFGPEVPTGRYKHPASITDLRGGDLYLVYYGGAGEYATETAVFGSRLKKGASAWSAPRAIARDPFRSLGNAVVWQAPDGVVWLFYVVRFGETWSTSRIQAKVSRDNAETWSDAFMLSPDPPRGEPILAEGMMVRNRPIVLNGGDYLLPIYHETGHDTEMVGPDSTSLFLRFNPETKQWKQTGRIRSATGNIQPAVVQLTDMHFIAYCRRGGGYGPTTTGFIVRAESHDGGWTWSEGRNSSFPNPNSAIEFLKLKSGALLLVYNDSMTSRTPLTAALSMDGDESYPYRRNIAEGQNSFAYPIGFQGADGLVHIVYTSDQRSVINHAVFSEQWVKGE
jgi:predicted neuraminidase